MDDRQPDRNALIDPFGRKVEYLRLSVADKCNLRCFYCLPKGHTDFQEPAEWLTFEEIERVIESVAADFEINMGKLGQPVRVAVTGRSRRIRQCCRVFLNQSIPSLCCP